MNFWRARKVNQFLKRRERLSESELAAELKPLLVSPPLANKTDIRQLDLLVLDFETTGFNPDVHHVLSMGWVVIRGGIVELSSARHILINDHTDSVNDSIKIHQLLPEELSSNGVSLSSAYHQLFQAMAGKLPLVHGAVVERGYFEHFIEQSYGIPSFPIPWLDTLKIEQAKVKLFTPAQYPKDWRLGATRERYGLPSYNAHNALVDAISTAELFLAQMKAMFSDDAIGFGDIMSLSQSL